MQITLAVWVSFVEEAMTKLVTVLQRVTLELQWLVTVTVHNDGNREMWGKIKFHEFFP